MLINKARVVLVAKLTDQPLVGAKQRLLDYKLSSTVSPPFSFPFPSLFSTNLNGDRTTESGPICYLDHEPHERH